MVFHSMVELSWGKYTIDQLLVDGLSTNILTWLSNPNKKVQYKGAST